MQNEIIEEQSKQDNLLQNIDLKSILNYAKMFGLDLSSFGIDLEKSPEKIIQQVLSSFGDFEGLEEDFKKNPQALIGKVVQNLIKGNLFGGGKSRKSRREEREEEEREESVSDCLEENYETESEISVKKSRSKSEKKSNQRQDFYQNQTQKQTQNQTQKQTQNQHQNQTQNQDEEEDQSVYSENNQKQVEKTQILQILSDLLRILNKIID